MTSQFDRVRLRATPDLDAGVFSLAVEVQPGLSTIEYQLVASRVELLVSAVNAGLGSGNRFSPWLSGAALVEPIGPQVSCIHVICREVDKGAVRLLANLISRTIEESGPLVHVVVSGERGGPLDSVPIAVETVPYPSVYAPSLFDVEIDLPNKSRVPISIRIEFATPLLESEVDLLWSRLELWEELVGKGGYLQSDSETSELPDLSEMEIYLLLPSEVEVTVYGFVAAEAAFDGLVNMLLRTQKELITELLSVQIW